MQIVLEGRDRRGMFANTTNKNRGGTNVLTNVANTVVNAAASGANAVVNAAANGANAVVNAAANGANAVVNAAANVGQNLGQGLNQGANAVTNAVQNLGQGLNQGVEAVGNAVQNVPSAINSIIPFSNNTKANNKNAAAATNNSGLFNIPSNNTGSAAAAAAGPANQKNSPNLAQQFANFFKSPESKANNRGNNRGNNMNIGAAAAEPSGIGSFLGSGLSIFIILLAVFLGIFAYYEREIRQGYEYVAVKVKGFLGYPTEPDVLSQITPSTGTIKDITTPPEQPEVLQTQKADEMSMVEKVLPSLGGNEVFNVAQNKFIYYDAEPLCKALGAELATYEQVKDAWSKGADWCNYGWVKGQMAIYPTQKETYDKLQNGPPDEKNACGTVGINGGTFDNPEMRFGVNCYGKKPGQTAHDEKILMEQGRLPYSADTLKVDRAVADFKAQADSLFIKPFNEDKWNA